MVKMIYNYLNKDNFYKHQFDSNETLKLYILNYDEYVCLIL